MNFDRWFVDHEWAGLTRQSREHYVKEQLEERALLRTLSFTPEQMSIYQARLAGIDTRLDGVRQRKQRHD
jgi:hypothetical protein